LSEAVMCDLRGRTVLLTGASRGIGAATAQALGHAGASVVAHYGSYATGSADATSAVPEERKLLVQADFSEPGSARTLWKAALAWHGRIDALIVNAAIQAMTPLDSSDLTWDENWAMTMQVNLLEHASLVREAVRHYLTTGGGIVIVVSSWAAQRGAAVPELIAYAASKAA